MVVFRQSGCIRTKVVVFGQKWFYLGKSGCICAKLLYSSKRCCNRAKMVVFVQGGSFRIDWLYSGKSGCIRAKVVLFGQ